MAINKFSKTIGKFEYTFDPDDSFEKDGKVFNFCSIRKFYTYKTGKGNIPKRQVLTWSKADNEQFMEFLRRIAGDEDW